MKSRMRISSGSSNYEVNLFDCIGRGGMGEVFLANIVGGEGVKKKVAVKRLFKTIIQEKEVEDKRFMDEVRSSTSLSHPNIVQTFAFGQGDDGFNYIIMEHVEGQTLRNVLDQNSDQGSDLDGARAEHIIYQITSAIAYLHTKRIIHRDISPENILIDNHGNVKLLDFGTSIEFGVEKAEREGKLRYCPPEVLFGKTPTKESDYFSLGVVIFEILFNFHPFEDDNESKVLDKIRENMPHFESVEGSATLILELVKKLLSPEKEVRKIGFLELKAKYEPQNKAKKVGGHFTRRDFKTFSVSKSKRYLRRLVLPLIVLIGILGSIGAILFFSLNLKHKTQEYVPMRSRMKIILNQGNHWIDLSPGKTASTYSKLELEPGLLTATGCYRACQTNRDDLDFLFFGKHDPTAALRKSKLSLPRFLNYVIEKASVTSSLFEADILPICGYLAYCRNTAENYRWLTKLLEFKKNQDKLSSAQSIAELKNIISQFDKDSSQKKIFEESELTPLGGKFLTESLFESFASDISPIDPSRSIYLLQLFKPLESFGLAACRQLGDEAYAALIGPARRIRYTNSRFAGELEAVIMPAGDNLRILEAKNNEIQVAWKEDTLKSSIFEKGVCFYSRKGSMLNEVTHWKPRVP